MKPVALYSTRSRAQGIAFSRSLGIGWPDTSQMPYVPSASLARAWSISSTVCCGLGRQHEVALALDGQGVALARLVVELGVAGLAVGGERSRPRP